jgi:hypothetical protein
MEDSPPDPNLNAKTATTAKVRQRIFGGVSSSERTENQQFVSGLFLRVLFYL